MYVKHTRVQSTKMTLGNVILFLHRMAVIEKKLVCQKSLLIANKR